MSGKAPDFVTRQGPEKWTVLVWAKPGGSVDAAEGVMDGRLMVKVRAKAVDNKANEAIAAFLARRLGLKPRQVEVVAGRTGRRKTVAVTSRMEPDWSVLASMRGTPQLQAEKGDRTMEARDLELISTYGEKDAELKALYEEHVSYEKILEKMEGKPFLTPAEELEIKEIKKKKLAGKTKLEAILMKYRKSEEN